VVTIHQVLDSGLLLNGGVWSLDGGTSVMGEQQVTT
jgi:hypothetical protein